MSLKKRTIILLFLLIVAQIAAILLVIGTALEQQSSGYNLPCILLLSFSLLCALILLYLLLERLFRPISQGVLSLRKLVEEGKGLGWEHTSSDEIGKLAALVKNIGQHLVLCREKNNENANSAGKKEEFLKNIQILSGTGSWTFDNASNLFSLSSQAAEILGQPKEKDISKERILSLVHPHDREKLSFVLSRSKDGEASSECCFRAIGPENSVRHIILRACSQMENGRVTTMGILQDTTSNIGTEQELLRTQFAVDNSPDEIYFLNVDGGFLYANRIAMQHFGLENGNLSDKTLFHINPELTPEVWRNHWDSMSAEGSFIFESTHRDVFGKIYPVQVCSYPLVTSEGTIACHFARDISSGKKTEQALLASEEEKETILNGIAEGVALIDQDMKIIWANRSIADIYFRSHVPKGEKCYQTLCKETEVCGFCPAVQCMAEGKAVEREVLVNGRDLRITASPAHSSGGANGCIVVIRDNTEYNRLQQQLGQTRKMEAIGQLAGGIAHDFNNQLSALLGFAEIMEESGLNEEQHSHMAIISRCARRCSELTRQLLAFARKGKYRLEPVDLNRLVKDITTMLRRTIDKRITIHSEFDIDPAIVRGDPGQLENAILNIALNARDAMPGGGTLAFRTALIDQIPADADISELQEVTGKLVELSVTDTGIGMNEQTREHIFEPFFTTKGIGKGTGMGLAAVYGTVKSHRGAIRVTSSPGKGSTFYIYFSYDRHTDLRSEKTGLLDIVRARTLLSGKKALVIDDEPSNLMLLKKIFSSWECNVTLAENGMDAENKLRETEGGFDFALLDMVMPYIDGKETLERLKLIQPELIVILITGFDIDENVRLLLKNKAKGIVQKPFRKSEIARTLLQILCGSEISNDEQ